MKTKRVDGGSQQRLVRRIVACAGGLRFGPGCDCPRCKLKKLDEIRSEYRQRASKVVGELGDWLRRGRIKSGLSLRTVAEAAGVSAAFLSDTELGRRTPTKETLDRILKAVGADAPNDKLSREAGH